MNQDKIWESFQNDPELQEIGCWNEGRIKYIASRVPYASTVLNIGVGQGKLEKFLVQKGVDVHSLDPSEATIKNIRTIIGCGKDKAKVGYSKAIPFPDNMFDLLIMTEVLEHLPEGDLSETFSEIKRVLKHNGKLIGTVPADEDLKVSTVICPKCGERFHRWGHCQSFSQKKLVFLLEKTFSEVIVVRKYFVHFYYLNLKGRVFAIFKWMQAILKCKGGDQNFYFEAKP